VEDGGNDDTYQQGAEKVSGRPKAYSTCLASHLILRGGVGIFACALPIIKSDRLDKPFITESVRSCM
jgi:hypothetical protein